MVFGSFKATINFSGRKKKKDHDNIASIGSFNGAYRTNRDEFFGYNSTEAQRLTIPAVMPSELQPRPERPIRATKSTSDLIRDKNLPQNLHQSNPAISQDPRGQSQIDLRDVQPKPNLQKDGPVKLQAEKKLEKQRLAQVKKEEKERIARLRKEEKDSLDQEKKRLKLAQQEQAKQEKLRKEREKKEAKANKTTKENKKGPAPKPLTNPLAVPSTSHNQPQPVPRSTNQANQAQPVLRNKNQAPRPQATSQYATNTLESSISRSSGPPPYEEKRQSENDKGNVSFNKPVDTGSWDLISQHREQLNRQIIKEGQKKQTTMDLNYKMGNDNSDA